MLFNRNISFFERRYQASEETNEYIGWNEQEHYKSEDSSLRES